MELIVNHVTAYLDGRFTPCSIGIDGGKIVQIASAPLSVGADRVIDAQGLCAIPGSIDTHVHLRAPGNDARETFRSGSMAAAAGGVTLYLEQPICDPPQYSPETLAHRVEAAEKESFVDFAFYGAAGSDYPEEIFRLADQGIVAYKTFLQRPVAGREREFINLNMADDYKLFAGMKRVARTGHLLMIHAENHVMIDGLEQELRAKGRITGIAHALSRPPITEYETIAKIILMAQETGTRLIFAHVSTPESMEMIKQAKRHGQEVYCETCVHYLTLDQSALETYGPFAKCNPPVRTREDIAQFWKYINDGTVDCIGSDHSPFLPSEKAVGFQDIFKAPPGLPGIDIRLPLMLDAALSGKMSLETMAEVMCAKPAKLFGFYPRKGIIGIGADADLVLFDRRRTTVLHKEDSYSNSRGSAVVYDGKTLKGRLLYTICRGRIVMHDGTVDPRLEGFGTFIKPLPPKRASAPAKTEGASA